MLQRSNSEEILEERKPFLEHLEDFRGTLIKILVSIGLAVILSFFFAPNFLFILKYPLIQALSWMGQSSMEKEILKSLTPAGAVVLSFKIALCSGLILSSPFSFFFLSRFFIPGLDPKQKKLLFPFFLWAVILFLVGISFCYWVALPQTLRFFWQYNEIMGIVPLWTIENYVSFALLFILAFGAAFEMPLAILFLVKIGILTPWMLKRNRRYAVVIILIIAAVLTPPDVLSQIILAIPLLLLYELCIWISSWASPHDGY